MNTLYIIVGVSLVQLLLARWLKERLSSSIKHEYGKELEEIKSLLRDRYDLSKAERDFYDDFIVTIHKYFAQIKLYEQKHGSVPTLEDVQKDQGLLNAHQQFINDLNLFLSRSYVFLGEESYKRLYRALDSSSTAADLANNTLDAMRHSIHPSTNLDAKTYVRDFQYR